MRSWRGQPNCAAVLIEMYLQSHQRAYSELLVLSIDMNEGMAGESQIRLHAFNLPQSEKVEQATVCGSAQGLSGR